MTDLDLLQKVMELDQNETAYRNMLLQPWFVSNLLPDSFSLKNQSSIFQKLATAL